MWSKITHALKPRQTHDDEVSTSQGEVLNKVFEQHPNLSLFHTNDSQVSHSNPSPPGSPSKGSRRGMFKRMSKAPAKDESGPPVPLKYPIGPPKKVRSPINMNASQNSMASNPTEVSRTSQTIAARSSHDILRPSPPHSQNTMPRSSADALRRPSLDLLRQESSHYESMRSQSALGHNDDSRRSPITPAFPERFNSVRSILRDPNTPGTGQNVRFFSRDAYKVLTPEQSMDLDQHPFPIPPPKDELSFIDRLNQSGPETSTPAKKRSPNGKSARPSVAEVFSPLGDNQNSAKSQHVETSDMSLSGPREPNFSNIFDMSQQLELSNFPPGLGFDVNAPLLDESVELNSSTNSSAAFSESVNSNHRMTSTPYKSKESLKGKEKATESQGDQENVPIPVPRVVDETIFHAKEKSARLPSPLHDRSQSFSFGQTVFYSMTNSKDIRDESISLKRSISENATSPSPSGVPSPDSSKGRSRALSDSVFQSMLRSTSPTAPEADINDESCGDLVVYSAGPSEPDPFSANAGTYYTPQTMIPATPPQGAPKHARKTSKEESLIFSLQTQLALQTELCSQYESDLRARDELVEILGKKLSDFEKDEVKRKAALRSWKKKVQDLEKACRLLEEEVEDSRHHSMERSVMDEASSEALRMLHRQIASLEREKGDISKREEVLREEIETLESLVKERSEDVMNLKEVLWSRDESERELKEGIREAKEQMEMMGNVSVGMIDEDELKKLVMERQQENDEEKARHQHIEANWGQEKEELEAKLEDLQVENAGLQDEVQKVKQQLSSRDEEYATLKAELEAQWSHTEKTSEKLDALEKARIGLENDREALKKDLEDLQTRTSNMEEEWTDGENKRNELEAEVQELWNLKEALEKDRDQIDYELQQEKEHSESLAAAVQERDDRLAQLEQEGQFAADNAARLEESNRRRDEEIAEYTQRLIQSEAEAERLREEMSNLKREHSHAIGEQNRALRDTSEHAGDIQMRLDDLVRQKAEADVEMKTSKERVNALKDEVERLRRQVHELQQESADKEVKIVQITKQRAQDKEDLLGMNIALDSKQQELELLKRKHNVRGTAGSTPAQPSKVAHRRDSSIFTSNAPISRPPSVISDSGTDTGLAKGRSTPSDGGSTRPLALGKSSRVNATATNASASKPVRGIEGSMGPPPMKPRPSRSLAGTPTPAGRLASLSRTPSVKPVPTMGASRSRTPSGKAEVKKTMRPLGRAGSETSLSDEKENVDNTSRRRNMTPAPM